jgi:hypothetical protein
MGFGELFLAEGIEQPNCPIAAATKRLATRNRLVVITSILTQKYPALEA